MPIRLFLAGVFIAVISGCATQNRTQTDQLQSRVVELEKKLEEKDSEIVDLQYEVKDLSSKVNNAAVASMEETSTAAPIVPAAKSSDGFIRVTASVEKVQQALKNANVYGGKVDGKAGPATKAAVVEFQKSKGLVADGIVGRKTWEILRTYLQ